MPITAQNLLDFAKECADRQDESSHRNASARAYYACYHEVLSILEHMPKAERSVHKALTDYLISEDAKLEKLDRRELKALSYMLFSMKSTRVTCDYALDRKFEREDAKASLYMANKVFDKCAEFKAQKNKLLQSSK